MIFYYCYIKLFYYYTIIICLLLSFFIIELLLYYYHTYIGKLKLSCDVIVVNKFPHQVIVFERTYIEKQSPDRRTAQKSSHHMIVFSLPISCWLLVFSATDYYYY